MRRILAAGMLALLFHRPAEAQKPTVSLVRIASGDAVLFGSLFAGEGAGPRPTVLLLTGHPGGPVVGRIGPLENVLQLAQPMQHAGFNVLAMNFRGSWGSGGRYGMVARIEDVKAAIAFIRSGAAKYNVDRTHLIVVGWSMGGFNALIAGIEDRSLACTVAIAPGNYGRLRLARLGQETAEPAELELPVPGLGGYTRRDQRREILANQPRFDVARHMNGFKARPLLIVQAKRDQNVPADEVRSYVDAARAAGAQPFDHLLIDADHAFTLEGTRTELATAVVSWLTRHCS
jgi:uncharacterized protein